ncbi:MAG: nitric oxide reductase transcriptional regulator NorR [Vibrio sp.]
MPANVNVPSDLCISPNSTETKSAAVEQLLLEVALKLNAKPPSTEQYQELIDALKHVLPCDACALFIVDEEKMLRPVAISGLALEVLGRRFDPKAHPRLHAILEQTQPVRFASDSQLPDPFDGLLALSDEHLGRHRDIDVHACMGCSLHVEGELVGALTLDAANPHAFDQLSNITLETFAAVAAATMRNISLFDALKRAHHQQKTMTQTLIEQANHKIGPLVGHSKAMQQLRANIKMVAPSNYAVLISGETGTGKELVAQSIYQQSLRADKPMVYVNCAALPESIAESELFGHVKGAFTGANANRSGKFELADGGTIFLDELGELPLLIQAKLLRVIQQGEVQRVGADQNKHIDVRIIAATNRDLEQEVAAGRFRADLFHRLNVFPIHIQPLRQRHDDIPILVGHILDKLRVQFGVASLYVEAKALQRMQQMPWPGNVRELEHALMRAALRAIQAQTDQISLNHFMSELALEHEAYSQTKAPHTITPPATSLSKAAHHGETTPVNTNAHASGLSNSQPLSDTALLDGHSMREAVEAFQKQLIEQALAQSNGVWSQAAKLLKMDRGNLYKMGKKLDVK